MMKVLRVPFLSIRKLLSLSSNKDLRYHLGLRYRSGNSRVNSILVLNLVNISLFETPSIHVLMINDTQTKLLCMLHICWCWPYSSGGIGWHNTGEAGSVTRSTVHHSQLSRHLGAVCKEVKYHLFISYVEWWPAADLYQLNRSLQWKVR